MFLKKRIPPLPASGKGRVLATFLPTEDFLETLCPFYGMSGLETTFPAFPNLHSAGFGLGHGLNRYSEILI